MNRTDRTDRTGRTDRTSGAAGEGVIPPHGGYENLKSYQNTVIVYDGTVAFCGLYIDRWSRTYDQMVQAARSGKQNVVEGSEVSGTSKKTELKLTGVARASLEELRGDYQDFLRQRGLRLWPKDSPQAKQVRSLVYASSRSYESYKSYLERDPETAANTMLCLIHQTNYLLDRQLKTLEKQFLESDGFTENLYRARVARRDKARRQ